MIPNLWKNYPAFVYSKEWNVFHFVWRDLFDLWFVWRDLFDLWFVRRDLFDLWFVWRDIIRREERYKDIRDIREI